MTKPLKIIFLTSSLLCVLLLSTILSLPYLIDAESIRQQIIDYAKEKTGQDLSIEGRLTFSVFPWLGFSAEQLAVQQPATLGSGNWLQIHALDIKVKLLPLLNKRIEVDTIRVEQPSINYVIAKDGSSSIDSLLAKISTETDETVSDKKVNDTAKGARVAAGLIIAGISLSKGKITINNQKTAEIIIIDDLNLTTANFLAGQSAPVSLSANLSTPQFGETTLIANSRLSVNLAQQSVKADSLYLRIQEAQGLQATDLTIGTLSFDGGKQLIQLKYIDLTAILSGIAKKRLNPSLSIPEINIDLEKTRSSEIDFLLAEKKLGFESRGNITIKDWPDNLLYKGQINTQPLAPKKLFDAFAINYQANDLQAFKTLSLDSHFSGSTKGLSLQAITAQLDESTLNGDISLMNFTSPKIRFDLSVDQFNLDRYLPKTTAPVANASSDKQPFLVALASPMVAFKQVPAKGVFRAQNFQVNGIKLKDFELGVDSNEKQVSLNPKATLYNGKLDTTIQYQTINDSDQLSIVGKANKINVGPLLSDAKLNQQLSGIATITTDIVLSEKNGKLQQTGKIDLDAVDGAISGAGIAQIIEQLDKKLAEKCDETRKKYFFSAEMIVKKCQELNNHLAKYRKHSRTSKKNALVFKRTKARVSLKNHDITNDQLSIDGEDFTIVGKGSIDTLTENILYHSTLTLNEVSSGGQSIRLEIPFKASGKMNKPDFTPDFSEFFKNLADVFKTLEAVRLRKEAEEKLGLSDSDEGQEPKDLPQQLEEDLKKKVLDKLFR